MREYLKKPPSREELSRILDLIDNEPQDLVRKDKRFDALGLDASQFTTRDQVTELLLEHPELMQRPIVIRGTKAMIARPPELLNGLFS